MFQNELYKHTETQMTNVTNKTKVKILKTTHEKSYIHRDQRANWLRTNKLVSHQSPQNGWNEKQIAIQDKIKNGWLDDWLQLCQVELATSMEISQKPPHHSDSLGRDEHSPTKKRIGIGIAL